VAVIGSGPSGMACTEQLLQKGYEVTVIESKPAPGGLLVYGILRSNPQGDCLLPVGDMEAAGAKFSFNTKVGKDIMIDDLFEHGFEAVFVGVGSNIDAPMEVPGEDLPGVYKATEFLARSNVDMELLPRSGVQDRRLAKRWPSLAVEIPPPTACVPRCAWVPMKSPVCTAVRLKRCPVE